MIRKFCAGVLALALFAALPLYARAAQLLIPVGELIALQLEDETVTVAAFDEVWGGSARDAGLKIGDQLMKVGSTPIRRPADVAQALADCGDEVSLTVRRGGKTRQLRLTPARTPGGPKLGVYLRQGIAGVGTVTYYDPDSGAFGALGHGVSGPEGSLVRLSRGSVFRARLESVKKGKAGEPGQLRGAAGEGPFAILERNTPCGVFGTCAAGWKGEPVPAAQWEEIKTGPAVIRSTVCGDGVREYSVEILKIYPRDRTDGRNLLLKVTDPVLLETTGGIVQGMSGSPILQGGRLIGAVTHVLVNDPTTGYGIFIENMLDAAA